MAFCIPANKVQSVVSNRSAANPDETPNALAAAYQRGDRIDIARYYDFPNIACHEEVPLWMSRSNSPKTDLGDGTPVAQPSPSTDSPRFTVLIAAHNAQDTIGATLESVLAQTCRDWEAYVVDDGSTDNTNGIVRGYVARDEHIHLVRQVNGGTGAARNAAAALARGEFLCILDADDEYRPNYLESQAAFIDDHPGYDIFSCNADAVRATGVVEPFDPARYPRTIVSFRLGDMVSANRIFVAAVVRSRTFMAVGGFREGVFVEDYDLWLRILARGGRHIHNPMSLVLYRIAEGGKTSRPTRALRSMIEVYEHLAATETIGATLRRAIREQIAATKRQLGRFEAQEEWRELQARLAASDFSDARRLYWAARKAPINRVRYGAGLGLVALSPRLLAAVTARSRRRSEWAEPAVSVDKPGIVSVAVYCDGREGPLITTLQSLERQTLAEFTVLLVGKPPSENDLTRIAPGLIDSNDRSMECLQLPGVVSTVMRNRAIGATRNRFAVELSCGDRIEPTALEKAAWALDTTPHAGVVAIGEPDPSRKYPGFGPVGLVALAHGYIELGDCMLRTTAWREIGGLDAGAPVYAADQDLLIRLFKRGWEARSIPETLIHADRGQPNAGLGQPTDDVAGRRWLRSRHRLFYARATAAGLLNDSARRIRRHAPFLVGIGHWVAWKLEVEGLNDRQRALRHPAESMLRLLPRPLKGRLWKRLNLPMRPDLWSYDPPLVDVTDAAHLRPIMPLAQTPGRAWKTRVLVVHQHLIAGGAETVVLNLLSRIDRNNFDVHLITTEFEPNGKLEHPWLARFAEQTDSIYQLPAFLQKDYFLRFLIDFISSRHVDVVLISLSAFTYQALPQLRAACPGTAFLDLLHAEAPYARMDHIRLASRYRQFLDRRVVITDSLRSVQISKYGETPDRVVVIPNGIDTDNAFNPSNSARGTLRRELGIDDEVAVVLYLGRLSWEKQPMHVVDVAEKLRGRSDIVFVLQGDGPEILALQNAISKRTLTNIRLSPAREDVRPALADADLAMFPSLREGLPVAGIEAMSMGKPIVASKVPGWIELISDGDDGFLVGDGDIAGYADAITRLLADPTLYDRMSRAGREKATHTYDLGDSIRAWERLLSALPTATRSGPASPE